MIYCSYLIFFKGTASRKLKELLICSCIKNYTSIVTKTQSFAYLQDKVHKYNLPTNSLQYQIINCQLQQKIYLLEKITRICFILFKPYFEKQYYKCSKAIFTIKNPTFKFICKAEVMPKLLFCRFKFI